MTGRIHHSDPLRGFGKITGDDKRQYFVARDELVDVFDLKRSQAVEFVATETARGPRALAVRPCERAVSR